MEEIDYNSKILNFLAMTETGDQETATKYLEEAKWDETTAVNNFFNKIKINSLNNNLINDMNSTSDSINNMLSPTNRSTISLTPLNNMENTRKINNKKKNRLCKIILGFIKIFFDCCPDRREISKNEEKKIFQILPNITDDFIKFGQSIKKKIGIIIFYTANNVQFLKNFLGQLSRTTMLMNMLKQNYIIYPLLANTNEGYKIQEIVRDTTLVFPSFAFCYNSSNNKNEINTNYILERNNIIQILESETITIKIFHDTIKALSNKYNINKKKNLNNEFDRSFGPLTDAEILNQQKYDMEELEREVQKKEEELEKEKKKEEKRKKEEEIKMKEIVDKAEEAKAKIVDEPNEDDPNSTIICFRYPDGEKTKNRRFLKSNTIQNLYDYITSLGQEIYTENENNHFSLYQPFPPKKYDIMENTLEKEGLFPNAVIQIREE